ncbi:MAG: hypothetical protein ACI4S9_08170, partial [Christensenellales bacterium]
MNTDFIRKLNIGLKYCLGDIHRTYVGKYDTVIDCGEFVRAEATIEAEGLRARAEDKFFPYGEGFEAVCGMTILNSQGIDGFGACYYFETYKKFGELRFFMPSCWYGNNSLMADGSSKCNYYGDIAGGSIDGISAPFLFSFCDGNAVCLTVADPGYGTVAGERVGSCVLAECTLPSIGIVERKSIKLFVENPGNTYNDGGEGVTTFRYRTARENLRIETKFTVNCGSYPDFCSAMRGIWRDYFGKFAVFNRDIDTGIARKAIFDGVVRSMGRVNGIPQFMTNCDHFVPESGFLYRNSDLAYLTLKEGYRRGDGELIGFATDVIDCQVKNAYAGENQFFPFDRSRAEGCHSILKAYGFLKEQGTEKPEWLNYALREKEYFSSRDEFYSVPLLLEFGEVAVASEKARRIFDENFSKMLFYGGITDFGGGKRCIDRESALKGLEIFLALYEYTGESHWLEKASFCADYLETYQNLQLIPFNT